MTNGCWRSRASEVEDDDSDGGAGHPATCRSMETKERSWRSSGTRRGVEGKAVAVTTANGGDGGSRSRLGPRDRGGEELQGERGK